MSSTTTSTSNKLNRKPFTPILSSAATTAAVCPPSTTPVTSSERALVKQHDPDSFYPILRQPLSPDRPSTTAGLMSVQRELEFAKAELAREQAQRKLDRQKADQESARLRRQMEFLLEELDGHKEESEKIRLQSEKDVQSWKHRLEDTIESLKSLEEDYNTLKNKYKQEHNISSSGTRQDQRWIDRCHGYEEEISKLREAFMSSEKRALEAEQKLVQYQKSKLWNQDEVDEKDEGTMDTLETTGGVKAVVASMISCRQQLNREPVTAEDYMDHFTSPSSRKRKKIFGEHSLASPNPPAAVLRELNKVRLSLADAERFNRILSRNYEEAKSKMHELRKVNEQYERSQERITLLETQYSSALKRLTTMEEVEKQWKLFRKELSFASPADQKTILLGETKMDITSSTPPEISAVIRKIQSMQNEVKEKGEECEKYRAQWEASNQRIQTLQSKLDAQMHSQSQIKQQQEQEKKRLDALQLEVDRAQAGERIAKMEAKNLQQLLDTYEVTEAFEVKEGTMKIPGLGSSERSAATGPVVAGLRTSLASAQEEINLLKETHLATCKQLEALQGRLDENLIEHERVLEKFNKLKTSLMEEREKATITEKRALHAESMAGKGFFDPDKTRALHMKENPFMDAVRAKYETQILALEATIERHKKESESSLKPIGSFSSLSTPATAAMGLEGLEAKKLNQRLKDTFQEHIGVFREAVYLLTGYKVDMIMDCDSPRFRVRSMYAEKEEDHLMFIWPKAEKGVREAKPRRLDLLDTDLAKTLSVAPTFEYLSKYDSLPAFLAALTLSLFENTTFTG